MSVLSELNLTEAYENLIGDPLYDSGNLKQSLCVQCSQTLRKFARFRDKSLRARSLMMELLEKHGSITTQHIKMLQCGHNQLKNNLVSTSLGPDHYDLLILEVDRQTDLEEVEHGVEIKNECNDFGSGDEVIKEDEVDAACVSEGFNEGLIKYESAAFMCRVCYEEFHSEHAYNANLSMHMHGDVQPSADSAHSMVTALSAGLATSTGNDEANSTPSSERALVSDGDASHTRALDSDSTVTSIRSCVVKLQSHHHPGSWIHQSRQECNAKSTKHLPFKMALTRHLSFRDPQRVAPLQVPRVREDVRERLVAALPRAARAPQAAVAQEEPRRAAEGQPRATRQGARVHRVAQDGSQY